MQIIETAATHQKPLQTRENEMGKNEFSWIAIDRDHETAELADEDFDAAVAAVIPAKASLIKARAAAGNKESLSDLVDDWTSSLGEPDVAEIMTRTALVYGAAAVGQLVLDLIQKAIDTQAELAALKDVERAGRAA